VPVGVKIPKPVVPVNKIVPGPLTPLVVVPEFAKVPTTVSVILLFMTNLLLVALKLRSVILVEAVIVTI
jgi:hypothetical protein